MVYKQARFHITISPFQRGCAMSHVVFLDYRAPRAVSFITVHSQGLSQGSSRQSYMHGLILPQPCSSLKTLNLNKFIDM